MPTTNSIITLAELRDELQTASGTTRYDAAMQRAIDSVARQFSQYTRRRFWSATETRYYTAHCTTALMVDDVLAVDAITLDTDGDSSFDTVMSSSCYYLTPYNASLQDPPQPYTELLVAGNSSAVFPAGVERGVRISGTFGHCYTSECPADVKSAALFQAAEDYRLGIMGESAGGRDMNIEGPRRMAGLHPSVRRVLDHYRRRTVG